ncbi:MAG: hypothetical protein ABI779_09575 [Acidobacteriota bacterium]
MKTDGLQAYTFRNAPMRGSLDERVGVNMSEFTQLQIDDTAALYSYRLGQAAETLTTLAKQAFEVQDLRDRLRHLDFYARRLRSSLPNDGMAIGPRWWQRYGQFVAMVEDLRHPEFDQDFESLWIGLPDPN